MSYHRGYAEQDTPPAMDHWLRLDDANRKARRSFWRGMVIGGLLVGATFIGGAAFGDTITIGPTYMYGRQTAGTTVTLEPSPVPGQLAIVTLQNQLVNGGTDNGTYTLTMDGLTVEVVFTWDIDPAIGSDQITVIPPEGVTCVPEDCSVSVFEGLTGQVVLFDWRGV